MTQKDFGGAFGKGRWFCCLDSGEGRGDMEGKDWWLFFPSGLQFIFGLTVHFIGVYKAFSRKIQML